MDLFKGEQQKNVDYAFLKSIENIELQPDQGLLIIYDIACQYWVHLQRRIGDKLPQGLIIDKAIGMFHVHGHKDDCFFRFAPSFIPGAAITSGEILEALWSVLNKISPSVCTASLAHRAEVLDDHACDSNHKKALNMSFYLCSRKKTAKEKHVHYKQYFLNLCKTFGQQLVDTWRSAIERAERERVDNVAAMDIYVPITGTRPPHIGGFRGGAPESQPNVFSGSNMEFSVKAWLEFAFFVEEIQ